MKKLSILMLAALVALAIVIPAAVRSRIEKTRSSTPNGRFTLESDVGSVTLTGYVIVRGSRGHRRGPGRL